MRIAILLKFCALIAILGFSLSLNDNWIYAGGSKEINYEGFYNGTGNKGIPPSLAGSATAVDNEGRLLLFGGQGYSNGSESSMYILAPILIQFNVLLTKNEVRSNHLWRFDGISWTLLYQGNESVPVKGDVGVYATENNPGGREYAGMVVDSNGLIWIHGGLGHSNDSDAAYLQDLWAFNGSMWAFMYGVYNNTYLGNFAVQGVASADNNPPGHYGFAMWINSDNKIVTFGGKTAAEVTNDIWIYDGSLWTWVRGGYQQNSDDGGDPLLNTPGGRAFHACHYINDSSIYIFGGYGFDDLSALRNLDELWRYSGSVWKLLSGDLAGSAPIWPDYNYGKGIPCVGCSPGLRASPVLNVESENSIKIGMGCPDTGNCFRDVWQFNGTAWTWLYGYNYTDVQDGAYYLAEGVASINGTMFPAHNRSGVNSWIDMDGNLWIHGGTFDSDTHADLWILMRIESFGTGNVKYDSSATNSTIICGFNGKLTTKCDKFEKARNLAYACGKDVALAGSSLDLSKDTLPLTLLEYNLTISSEEEYGPMGSSVLDFGNTGAGMFAILAGTAGKTVTFAGIDFGFNSSNYAIHFQSSRVVFDRCTFSTTAVSSSNEDVKIIHSEGAGGEIIFKNCTVVDVTLTEDQRLFYAENTKITAKNLDIMNAEAPAVADKGYIFGFQTACTMDLDQVNISNSQNTIFSAFQSSGTLSNLHLKDNEGYQPFYKLIGNAGLLLDKANVAGGIQFLDVAESSSVNIKDSLIFFLTSDGDASLAKISFSELTISNTEIYSLTADNGATISAVSFSNVVIKDSDFNGNSADLGALVSVTASSTLDMYNVTSYAHSCYRGGIVYLNSGATATVSKCKFTSSSGSEGAAFYVAGSSFVNISHSILEDNQGFDNGGVFFITDGSSVLSEWNSYRRNYGAYGGGVTYNGGTWTSNDEFFEENASAYGYGGVVYAVETTTVRIRRATMVGNWAEHYGGAIYGDAFILEMESTSISGGRADEGGALYLSGDHSSVIEDILLNKNKATSAGGAAVILGGVYLDATNVTFEDNWVEYGGIGGALVTKLFDAATYYFCSFKRNNATYGGGIFITESYAYVFIAVEFIENRAIYGGGAIFQMGEVMNWDGYDFFGNEAGYGANYTTTAWSIVYPSEYVVNSGDLDLIMNITVKDYYGNVIVDPQYRKVSLKTDWQLIGAYEEPFGNGYCPFTQTGLRHEPGSTGWLQLTVSEELNYGGYLADSDVPAVNMTVRTANCSDYEIIAFSVCSTCTTGQYVSPVTHECIPCISHAYCNGTHIVAEEGYWGADPRDLDVLHKCPLEGACPGGLDYYKCNSGYEGVVCALCEDGYGPVGESCAACGNNIVHALAVPAATVAVALILCAMVFSTSLGTGGGDTAGTKILFNYVQTVAILTGLITLKQRQTGSSETLGIFSAFSLDLNVISIHCLKKLDYYDILWLQSAFTIIILVVPWLIWLPLLLVGVIISLFGLLQLIEGESTEKYGKLALKYGISFMRFSNRYRNMYLITLYSLLLPRVAGHIMSLFSCVDIDGTRYLSSDYSVICSGAKYYLVMAYAVALFTLFVVGSLFFLFSSMLGYTIASWRLSKTLEEEVEPKDEVEGLKPKNAVARTLDTIKSYLPVKLVSSEDGVQFEKTVLQECMKYEVMSNPILKWGVQAVTFLELESALLYFQRGYKTTRFFWELVISLRKILILSAVVFTSDVVLKSLVILLILVIFSIFHLLFSPFRRRIDNIAEFLSLLALVWVTVIVVMHELYTSNSGSDTGSYTRDVVLVVLMILAVAIPTGAMIFYSFMFSNKTLKFHHPGAAVDVKRTIDLDMTDGTDGNGGNGGGFVGERGGIEMYENGMIAVE